MLQPGEQIDIWVVEKALGAGGMGSVYRCHNKAATRILAAVKVLESSLRRHPEAEARFIREAEILFQLDHPNIVKVRNVRTDTDPPYLEMEFVAGESLEDKLRRGALPYDDAVEQMKQIASAITYLHDKGVRHRDLKPANLLVTDDGVVKVVDFGLAMEADVTRLTQSGMTFGTVSYAPPEWITPDQLDPERWDIYAIGVVYYEMLTGKVAFPVSGQGSARQQAMQVIVGKQNAAPLDPGDRFHDDVRALIVEMTAKDPATRPSSAKEVFERVSALRRELARDTGQTLVNPPSAIKTLGPGEMEAPKEERVESNTWISDSEVGAPSRKKAPKLISDGAEDEISEEAPVPSSNAPTLHMPADSLPVAPSRTGGRVVLGIGILAVLGVTGAGLIGAAVILGPQLLGGDATRNVDVVVAGVERGAHVGLRMGDLLPASSEEMQFHFKGVPVGEAEVTWVLGKGCRVTECPGSECPAWCGQGTSTQTIEAGESVQTLALSLPAPKVQTVSVSFPELAESDASIAGMLAGVTATEDADHGLSFEVPPGEHELIVTVGSCKKKAYGCWPDGDCPDSCRSARRSLVVPWSADGGVAVSVDVPAPSGKTKGKGKRKVTTTPKPAPDPVPGGNSGGAGAGKVVTSGSFSRWLDSHPEWHKDAAVAAKRADGNYLKGWTGTKPAKGGPAVNVSWYAAAAYCKSRGGLASVTAEPTSWSDGPGQPFIEWRTDGGKAAFRTSDGRQSTAVKMKESNTLTGFRCAR